MDGARMAGDGAVERLKPERRTAVRKHMEEIAETSTFSDVLERFPYAFDFFSSRGITAPPRYSHVLDWLREFDRAQSEEEGSAPQFFDTAFIDFLVAMEARRSKGASVTSIEILAGTDKDGNTEKIESVSAHPGEIICLLGPTGAGKSQMLNDLEALAQGDTPTHRRILVDGLAPDEATRYELAGQLIAQLSQNMNFVMDLPVLEFLIMHAQCRLAEDPQLIAAETFKCANQLAGEPFSEGTPLTALSGGQSRALMVADVALLSSSPIVLLDEIENAGIDKWQAFKLLAQKQKIVLVSTHDPVIALMGTRRVIFSNGAMSKVIENDGSESDNLTFLREIDKSLSDLRADLRTGEVLVDDLRSSFASHL